MEAPMLQILVQKGPKSGETLDCKPGPSATRIGRVIKGNDFALRDPGVSQQHLRFEFLPEASGWFVTDLDSSNGTFLNGSEVVPSVRVPVSDGDVVKVGDKTELVLRIDGGLKEKNERRVSGRVRSKSRVLKEVDEAKGDEIRVSRSRRNIKAIVSDEEEEEGGKLKEASKSDYVSDLGEIEGAKEEKSRALRGRRKNAASANNEEKRNGALLNSDSIVDLGAIEIGQKRRGRPKKIENSSKISEEKEEMRDSVANSCLETEEQEEVKLRRNPRRARVLKDLDGNSNRITRANKGKQIRVSESEEQKGKQISVTETEDKNDDSDFDCVLVSDLRNEGERNFEKTEVDFGKMTLGEWFDRMELIFPKIIRDESEQIKNILRAKSQILNEFLKSGDDQKGI